MAYTCKTCGSVADDPGHLCNPSTEKLDCSFCGAKDVGVTHVCKEKLNAMKFACQTCGRMATAEERLCKPAAIE